MTIILFLERSKRYCRELKMKNFKTRILSLTLAMITALSLVGTNIVPAYALELITEPEETTISEETEDTSSESESTEEQEVNSTLITIIARNSDDNTRISTALISIKDKDDKVLSFVKVGEGEYQYSSSGTIKALETNSKGKVIISNLEQGTYTAYDAGTEKTYICEGNNKFMISSLSDNLEVSLDYSLNVGSLTLTFLDGDDNSAIEKGRFVLKDYLGNLIDVTCTSPGNYECSNSQSGAGEFITNSSGKVTVTKIPSGKYTLEEVYAPSKYNSGYVIETVTIAAKEVINVTVTNTKLYGDVNIKISSSLDESKLKGYVFKIANSEGFALPMYEANTNQYYYNRGGENTAITVKSASDLSIIGLPEGSYILHMEKGIDDYKKINDVSFKVEDGKITTISLNPQRSVGSLSIKKMDETTEKGLKGFKLSILDETKAEMHFVKNEDGTYTYTIDKNGLNILETNEDGKILVKELPTGTVFIKEISASEGYLYSREEIEQTISEDIETVYKSKSQKSNCALEFVDKDGNPIEGVSVVITDDNNKTILESKSNANGYILMSNISEGKYIYEIIGVPEGYSLPQIKSEFTVDSKGIASGLEKIKVDFNKIEIQIAGVTGDLTGFEFIIVNTDGKELKTSTDLNGLAIFEKIPFGQYSLKNTKAPKEYELSEEVFDNILIDDKYENASNKYTFNIKEIEIESTTTEQVEKSNGGITTIIIVLVFILLAAIGGIVFVLIKPKKDENNTDDNKENIQKDKKTTQANLENKVNKEIDKEEKKSKENKKETLEIEPIIITEEISTETIIETTTEKIAQEENIIIPDDINDRKPKKDSSGLIDPFNK